MKKLNIEAREEEEKRSHFFVLHPHTFTSHTVNLHLNKFLIHSAKRWGFNFTCIMSLFRGRNIYKFVFGFYISIYSLNASTLPYLKLHYTHYFFRFFVNHYKGEKWWQKEIGRLFITLLSHYVMFCHLPRFWNENAPSDHTRWYRIKIIHKHKNTTKFKNPKKEKKKS